MKRRALRVEVGELPDDPHTLAELPCRHLSKVFAHRSPRFLPASRSSSDATRSITASSAATVALDVLTEPHDVGHGGVHGARRIIGFCLQRACAERGERASV